ncbi:flavin reductase family protein [Rhodococcus rhodochrous]|uniref:Flavin reductase family protein n=1 Tax=Rhodococcus rhodochrous TaxID=1829 RepID=A0AA46X305_RHORH|nr:flavin reductase family protein [Rhodococcus rhodochrous]UZF48134.1 flavin reductase family protein [Rhodococcus rhodochrous]
MTRTDLPAADPTVAKRKPTHVVAHSDDVRAAFNEIPTAIAALCSVVDGEPCGMVATSLTVGVSYDPPMVALSILNTSTTWPALKESPRIGISILSETQDRICRQLASKSGNRFEDLATTASAHGALFLDDSPTWLDCTIDTEVPAGDHHLILLQVHGVNVVPKTAPLLYYRSAFHRLSASTDLTPQGTQ